MSRNKTNEYSSFPSLRAMHWHILENPNMFKKTRYEFNDIRSAFVPPAGGKSHLTIDEEETEAKNGAVVYEDINREQFGLHGKLDVDIAIIPYFDDEDSRRRFLKGASTLETVSLSVRSKHYILCYADTITKFDNNILVVENAACVSIDFDTWEVTYE